MKSKHFIAIAFISAIVAAFLVAQHRDQASSLGAAMSQADAAGTDTTIQSTGLQAYTSAHMLTATSVFMKGSYDRAAAAAKAAALSQANGTVYAQAQAACDKKGIDSIRQATCVQQYVASHSQAMPNPQPVAMPTQADYTKTYKSPGFTTDDTGIAILVALSALITAGYLKINRQ